MRRNLLRASAAATTTAVIFACSGGGGGGEAPGASDGGAGGDGSPSTPLADGAIGPSATAEAEWVTSFPTGFDSSNLMAVASNGTDLFAAGAWRSDASPFNPAEKNPGSGTNDAVGWVARFDAAGKLLWATSFLKTPFNGGGPRGLAALPDGSSYVAGIADVPLDFGNGAVPKGSFIVKLDPLGAVQWARSIAPAADPSTFEASDVAADAEGAWVATTLHGSGVVDGAPLPFTSPAKDADVALLRFSSAGVHVATESFLATKGGVRNPTVVVRDDGSLVLTGSLADKMVSIGTKSVGSPYSSLLSNQHFWAALPRGSHEPSWMSGTTNQGAMRARFARSGPGALVMEYNGTPTLAGKTFPSDGVALLGVSEVDGKLGWALPYAPPKPISFGGPSISSVVASPFGAAMIGDLHSADIEFGSGVLSKTGFLVWAGADGAPRRSLAIRQDARGVFDDGGSLFVAGNNGPGGSVAGQNAPGYFFAKLRR